LISPPKERRFGQLGFPAGPASRSWEVNMPAVRRAPKEERRLILQVVQPGLLGLMDGSVSTLAPLFATAAMTGSLTMPSWLASPPRWAPVSAWGWRKLYPMTARYPVEEVRLSEEA
jgi:hypothetical protein